VIRTPVSSISSKIRGFTRFLKMYVRRRALIFELMEFLPGEDKKLP